MYLYFWRMSARLDICYPVISDLLLLIVKYILQILGIHISYQPNTLKQSFQLDNVEYNKEMSPCWDRFYWSRLNLMNK